jgi:DNA-binding MarR family transcriptional regulator
MNRKSEHNNNSISGLSAEHFITKDDSLASLLLNHGIQVRDFILLSFLSDQGPMTAVRLARVVGIEPSLILEGIKRLSAANLLVREPSTTDDILDSVARLTTRGEEIASRISDQIENHD